MANPRADVPFCTIESAQEYMALLADTIVEAGNDIEGQIAGMSQSSRHVDALRIALYNLHKLDRYIQASRRALNDLRTLRRLIAQERGAPGATFKPTRTTASARADEFTSTDEFSQAA